MSGVDFDRVTELLVELRALGPEQRAARLEEVSADDPELRAEVESILAHSDSKDFLDAPALRDVSARAFAAAIAEADEPAVLPEVIGRYRILERIGTGGMGTVYRAEQDSPRREVALKVIRPHALSRNLLRRFRQEAEILGRLQHPGIARIYDAGTIDFGEGGQPYFAMELIRGKPLTRYATEAKLGARERLKLFARACDAVEHAHQKGVIHRDLKPDNMLVQDDGEPKILDFGIARVTDSDIQVTTLQTEVGQVIGTVPYMSPEQVAGDVRDLDTRTDVYALGVVLYELLSGRLPHDLAHRSIPEAARIIRDEEPTRLSSISTAFRGDVDTIVAKAMAKESERRYPSAAALAVDIRRHLADQPIVARPASTFYQLSKFVRRNKALVGGVAVAFVAMFVGTILALWQLQVARLARHEAELEAYLSKITGASAAIAAEDAVTARSLLESADAAFRNWEWQYLHARLDRSIVAIGLDSSDPFAGAAFSVDGRQVLTVTRDGLLERRDLLTGDVVSTLQLDGGQLRTVVFSEDRSLLAGTHGSGEDVRIGLWETASGQHARAFEDLDGPVHTFAIAPDGRYVAATVGATAAQYDIFVWMTTGEHPGLRMQDRVPRELGALATHDLVFSLDATQLVAIGNAWGAGRVETFDTSTGERVGYQRSTHFTNVVLTRGPLMAISKRKLIELRDTETSQTDILTGHTSTITAVAFSHDETMLASGDAQTVRVWDVATKRGIALLTGHTDRIRQVSFSPDGSRLLSWSADGTVRIWLLSETDPTTVLRGHESYVYAVDFSPDGTRLVTSGWDGTVRVWDAAGGELLTVLETGSARTTGVRYTPDGRFIVAAAGDLLQLWDADTGALRRTVNLPNYGGDSRPAALAMSRDGLLASTRRWGAAVHLFRPTGGDGPLTLPGALYAKSTFSPDGRHVAVGRDTSVAVADTSTGEIVRAWPTPGMNQHNPVAWSPDGAILASGHIDDSIRLWDAETGAPLAVLEGHSAPVYALVFSPDGSRLASGAEDTTIRIWAVADRREVLELRGHEEYVYDLAFSPDGSRLASASGDTTVKIWDTRPKRQRWLARDRMRALRDEATPLVDGLIEDLGDQTLVAEALQADSSLGPQEREAALQVLLQRPATRTDDCNGNGRPDHVDLTERSSPDCDGNYWPDECDLTSGRATDVNANGVPDVCEDCNRNDRRDDLDIAAGTSADRDRNGVPDECERRFPATLADNTTGHPDATYTGPPDGIAQFILKNRVTFDLGGPVGLDGPGPDLNVYEAVIGPRESWVIHVLVSLDGVEYRSVKSGESHVRVPGDQGYREGRNTRSYDIASSGLAAFRFIRVEGSGYNPLDAVGVIHLGAPDLE